MRVNIRLDATIAPFVGGQAGSLDSWPPQSRTVTGIKSEECKDCQVLQRRGIVLPLEKMECERQRCGLYRPSTPSDDCDHPDPLIGGLRLKSHSSPRHVE